VSTNADTKRRFYLIVEVTSWQHGMLAHYKSRSGVSGRIGSMASSQFEGTIPLL
jgi:hypothetical protein